MQKAPSTSWAVRASPQSGTPCGYPGGLCLAGRGDDLLRSAYHRGRSGRCRKRQRPCRSRTADMARERALLARELAAVRLNACGPSRISPGADLEQFDNDSLFGPGRCGARATTPGCPSSEVKRGGAAVVLETRIGTGEQEGLDSSRTSVSDSSMQWCHTAGGGRVGISARLDEIKNGIPLACRVPACRAGHADHRPV
jgi:hypothetical protein